MVIGIGGCSRSGKTTLAELIKNCYSADKTIIIHQDDFIPPTELIPTINGHIDWECPQSIDFEAYNKAIVEASGKFEIIIAEGLFAFSNQEINKLYDRRILMHIDKETFVYYKNQDLRWGREPDWYVEHIWNSHLKYGIPTDGEFYLDVEGSKAPDIERVIKYLENGR